MMIVVFLPNKKNVNPSLIRPNVSGSTYIAALSRVVQWPDGKNPGSIYGKGKDM